MTKQRYWSGPVPKRDDFGDMITDTFVDGKTSSGLPGLGRWARMSWTSWLSHGIGRLGVGLGQKYRKQSDGRWLKVES